MDISWRLQEQVQDASAAQRPLRIRAGATKSFYGRPVDADAELDLREHTGIVDYQPAELYVTVRAGTRLQELQEILAEQGQMLAFEPPGHGEDATIGGVVACGFSGPARPYAGAVRDHLLGVRILDGRGQNLHFGGHVMKNVAGYDLSRLMVGAQGTLGVLLELSLKVLPVPLRHLTFVQERLTAAAIREMNQWVAQPVPLSASAYVGGQLYLRFSAPESALAGLRARVGGDLLAPDEATQFWGQLRDQRLSFFAAGLPVWRLAVPPSTSPFLEEFPQLMEWGGGLRWLRSDADAEQIRAQTAERNGHAILYRAPANLQPFPPLPDALRALHARVKQAMDPRHILNPGRLYTDL
ncbi:glycolate oxidase subunit GlcE [Acidithiobacillus sp. IBUN Pt1247-S3]|uniref:glycolate oxidase subunit GlcE n=1 Tax=Acidithiobacillus sp. IBUN Pt1247-S3 TaxID=3166642 RepID=UPI0034E57632